jgi:hypothetical protein
MMFVCMDLKYILCRNYYFVDAFDSIRFDSIRFDSIHTSIRIKTDTHAICTKYRISLLLLYLLCIYSLCIYLLSLSYSLPTLHVIDFLSYHTQTVQLRTCVSILSTHSPTHSLTHSLKTTKLWPNCLLL